MTTVTMLSDNFVSGPRLKGLRAEWGFAAAVDEMRFDTRQSGAAADNARKLGVRAFETIVPRPDHYDHTKGLPSFPDDAGELYCHPDAFEPRYHDEEAIDAVEGSVVTSTDVADILGITTESARQHLNDLVSEGTWRRRRTGRTIVYWRVTEDESD